MTRRPAAGVQALLVFRKEMLDHLRDRRSLLLSLLYPLLGPVLLGLVLWFGAPALRTDAAAPPARIAASGIELAPGLAEHLEARGIVVVPSGEDIEAMVLAGRMRAGLIVSAGAAGPPTLELRVVYDPNNVTAATNASRLIVAAQEFARARAQASWRAAGVAPEIAEPVLVLGRTVGRGRDPASVFYALIPPLLMFMIFLGGTHLAIDTTAGERERGSLEPLLTAPVERSTLLVGKASAALAFTVLTVLVHLIAFMLILGAVAHGTSGLRPPPDLAAFATILAIAVPVMVVAVALQFLIATITRSMKEAQIYLGLLPVVPAMPGMVMALTTAHAAKAVAAVPILGQLVAFTDIAVGQAPSWSALALASFGTLAIAAAAFWAATRAFERMRQLSPA